MGSRHCRLLRVDEVPVTFQELFIRSGYREPNISVTQCIRSCFQLTNETLNVWTHLLPGFYFLWLLGNQSRDMNYIRDPYTWPMLCFMLALILFTFASALAHVLNALSDSARHTCFFVDYWAINMYAIGGAIAYRAYLLPRALIGTKFASVFLYISFFNAVIPMWIMCKSRFLQYSKLKTVLRLFASTLPYFFTNLTLLYRILLFEEEDHNNTALWLYFRQFCMAFLSAFFYTSHVPERFTPGVFDIFGHSHQIFHICAVMGSRDQMRGTLLDMTGRKEYLTANDSQVTFGSSLGLFIMVGLINLAILYYFRGKLKSKIT